MTLHRTRAGRGPRPSIFSVPVLLAGLVLLGCSPREGSREGEGAGADEEPAAAAGEGAMAAGTLQETPACGFTASGDELTNRLSPPDSASAELGGEVAKICYGAPSARDREIMGGLVPYGEPWRMGANEPTTLHLPFSAEVGGVRVDPGSYALYAVPGETEWMIFLNSDPDRWGVPINEAVRAQDVGSFTVEADSLEQPVERMTIDMETVGGDSATVVFEWASTRVSFPVVRVEG